MGARTTVIEPVLFGFMFCIFATYPVEEQLIYRKFCHQKFNSSYCQILYNSKNESYKNDQNILQEGTAHWEIYFNIVRSLPAIFVTLVCGIWSDRIGRKKFMILPIIGNFLLIISYMLNCHFFDAPIPFMLIGLFISSFFGGYSTMLSTLYSYVADVTTESFRTKRTLILESMVPLGSVLSNLGAGYILQMYGFMSVFATVLCIYGLQIIYCFFIEESYSNSDQWSAERTFLASVLSMLRVLTMKRPNRFRMTFWLLIGCFFSFTCLFIGLNQCIVLYMLHQPFSFSSSMIGYFLAEFNAIKFIGACLFNYFLLHRLRWHDNRMIVVCGLAYAGLAFCIGFSNKSVHLFVCCIWAAGLSLGNGAVRGRLSKLVSPSEQGKLFALIASLEVIIGLFTGVMFNAIYEATVRISPSIAFYFLGSLSAIPLVLALVLILHGETGSYSTLWNCSTNENEGPDIEVNS